jgi:hypothetical protein
MPSAKSPFLMALYSWTCVRKVMRGRHVERRRRERHQHHVGASHRVAQVVAVQPGGGVNHPPLVLPLLVVVLRFPRACNTRKQRRTPLEPFRRRALGIEVAQHDVAPLAREPAGDIGRERRLAAAAFRIGDENRLHRNSPCPPGTQKAPS